MHKITVSWTSENRLSSGSLGAKHGYDKLSVMTIDVSSVYGRDYQYIDRQLLCYNTGAEDPREGPIPPNPQADLHFACMCWQYCCRTHEECKLPKTAFPKMSFDLSLIDCSALAIVKAREDNIYAALSYVWGTAESQSNEDDKLSCSVPKRSRFPKTIRDAISVCLNLRIPYLWVDRYCIDYSNITVQTHQINNMHRIYQQAALTIIAHSAGSSEDGLAGVDGTDRNVGQYMNVGEFRILPYVRSKAPMGQTPKWSKRGWTMQEEFFSRRKLFFAEQQLVFECSKMTCHESDGFWIKRFFEQGTQAPDVGDTAIFRLWERSPEHDSFAPDNQEALHKHITDFVERDLSMESDQVRALAGILQHYFEQQRDPAVHIWGLPIRTTSERDVETHGLEASFLRSLCWTAKRYKTVETPRRRTFPSWSWAGWRVQHIRFRSYPGRGTAIETLLEYADGRPQLVASLPFTSRADAAELGYPQALHLNNVLVISPSAVKCEPVAPQHINIEHDDESANGFCQCAVGDHLKGYLRFPYALSSIPSHLLVQEWLSASRLEILVLSIRDRFVYCFVIECLPSGEIERFEVLCLEQKHRKSGDYPPTESILMPLTYAERRNFRIT